MNVKMCEWCGLHSDTKTIVIPFLASSGFVIMDVELCSECLYEFAEFISNYNNTAQI